MRKWIMLVMAVLLFLEGCAGCRNLSPEELEAIRRSNENYERTQAP